MDGRRIGCDDGRRMELGSGLCLMVLLGISSAEPLVSATRVSESHWGLHLHWMKILKWILGKLFVKM